MAHHHNPFSKYDKGGNTPKTFKNCPWKVTPRSGPVSQPSASSNQRFMSKGKFRGAWKEGKVGCTGCNFWVTREGHECGKQRTQASARPWGCKTITTYRHTAMGPHMGAIQQDQQCIRCDHCKDPISIGGGPGSKQWQKALVSPCSKCEFKESCGSWCATAKVQGVHTSAPKATLKAAARSEDTWQIQERIAPRKPRRHWAYDDDDESEDDEPLSSSFDEDDTSTDERSQNTDRLMATLAKDTPYVKEGIPIPATCEHNALKVCRETVECVICSNIFIISRVKKLVRGFWRVNSHGFFEYQADRSDTRFEMASRMEDEWHQPTRNEGEGLGFKATARTTRSRSPPSFGLRFSPVAFVSATSTPAVGAPMTPKPSVSRSLKPVAFVRTVSMATSISRALPQDVISKGHDAFSSERITEEEEALAIHHEWCRAWNHTHTTFILEKPSQPGPEASEEASCIPFPFPIPIIDTDAILCCDWRCHQQGFRCDNPTSPIFMDGGDCCCTDDRPSSQCSLHYDDTMCCWDMSCDKCMGLESHQSTSVPVNEDDVKYIATPTVDAEAPAKAKGKPKMEISFVSDNEEDVDGFSFSSGLVRGASFSFGDGAKAEIPKFSHLSGLSFCPCGICSAGSVSVEGRESSMVHRPVDDTGLASRKQEKSSLVKSSRRWNIYDYSLNQKPKVIGTLGFGGDYVEVGTPYPLPTKAEKARVSRDLHRRRLQEKLSQLPVLAATEKRPTLIKATRRTVASTKPVFSTSGNRYQGLEIFTCPSQDDGHLVGQVVISMPSVSKPSKSALSKLKPKQNKKVGNSRHGGGLRFGHKLKSINIRKRRSHIKLKETAVGITAILSSLLRKGLPVIHLADIYKHLVGCPTRAFTVHIFGNRLPIVKRRLNGEPGLRFINHRGLVVGHAGKRTVDPIPEELKWVTPGRPKNLSKRYISTGDNAFISLIWKEAGSFDIIYGGEHSATVKFDSIQPSPDNKASKSYWSLWAAQVAQYEIAAGFYRERAIKFAKELDEQDEEINRLKNITSVLEGNISDMTKQRDKARGKVLTLEDERKGLSDQVKSLQQLANSYKDEAAEWKTRTETLEDTADSSSAGRGDYHFHPIRSRDPIKDFERAKSEITKLGEKVNSLEETITTISEQFSGLPFPDDLTNLKTYKDGSLYATLTRLRDDGSVKYICQFDEEPIESLTCRTLELMTSHPWGPGRTRLVEFCQGYQEHRDIAVSIFGNEFEHEWERSRAYRDIILTLEGKGNFGRIYQMGNKCHQCPSMSARGEADNPFQPPPPPPRGIADGGKDPQLRSLGSLRNDPVTPNGYVVTRLRHEKIYPEHRSIYNDHVHGLRDYKNPEEFPQTNPIDIEPALELLKSLPPSKILITTGNSNGDETDLKESELLLNFRTGSPLNHWSMHKRSTRHYDLYAPKGTPGASAMCLRLIPFLSELDSQIMVVNGPFEQWPEFRQLDPVYPPVQVRYAAGGGWIAPSYAGGTITTVQAVKPIVSWLKTAIERCPDLYGVDELVLSKLPQVHFIKNSRRLGYITLATDLNIDVTYINATTNETLFSLARWNHQTCAAILRWQPSLFSCVKFYPKPPDYNHLLSLPDRKVRLRKPCALTIVDDGGKTLLVNAYKQFVTPTHSTCYPVRDAHRSSPTFIDICCTKDVITLINPAWDNDQYDIIGSISPIRRSPNKPYHKVEEAIEFLLPETFFTLAIALANSKLETPIIRDRLLEISEANPRPGVTGYDKFPLGLPRDSRFRVTTFNGEVISKVWVDTHPSLAVIQNYAVGRAMKPGEMTGLNNQSFTKRKAKPLAHSAKGEASGEFSMRSFLVISSESFFSLYLSLISFVINLFSFSFLSEHGKRNGKPTPTDEKPLFPPVRTTSTSRFSSWLLILLSGFLLPAAVYASDAYFGGSAIQIMKEAEFTQSPPRMDMGNGSYTDMRRLYMDYSTNYNILTGISLPTLQLTIGSVRVVFIILLTMLFVLGLIWAYVEYKKEYIVFPLLVDQPGVTYSDQPGAVELEDDYPVSRRLLITTCGTRGDAVPVHFYARLAASFGVRTDVWNIKTATLAELDELKRGDFSSWLPSSVDMWLSEWRGYKFVFGPHIELGPSGENYFMGPSFKWIKDFRYSDSYLSSFVSLLGRTFNPSWRIGSLSDCNLPRANYNGTDLLRSYPNKGVYEEGWVCGSADEHVIPEEIRNRCPRIPAGDHAKLFADYKHIHMHGGAGTVQTAIAAGCTYTIYDTYLDRDYHTLPTSEDFYQPSVLPFLGSLIWNGFSDDIRPYLSTFWYYSAQAAYFWAVRGKFYLVMADWFMRFYLVTAFLRETFTFWIVLWLSVPTLFKVANSKPGRKYTVPVMRFIYRYPVFLAIKSALIPYVLYLIFMQVVQRISFEVNNWFKNRTSLIIRQVQGFPLPFGHMILVDNITGRTWEGLHVERDGFFEPFSWISRTVLNPARSRLIPKHGYYLWLAFSILATMTSITVLFLNVIFPLSFLVLPAWAVIAVTLVLVTEPWFNDSMDSGDHELIIPLPFVPAALDEMMKNAEAKPYHPFFNCQSIVLYEVQSYAFLSTFFLLIIFLFTLFILLPGSIATLVARRWNISFCGVNLSESLLKNGEMAAAFSGDKDHGEENSQVPKPKTVTKPPTESPAAGYTKEETGHSPDEKEKDTNQLSEFQIEQLEKAGLDPTLIPETKAQLAQLEHEATKEFHSLPSLIAQVLTLTHLAKEGKPVTIKCKDPETSEEYDETVDVNLTAEEGTDLAIRAITYMLAEREPPTLLSETTPLPPPINYGKDPTWWARFVKLLHKALAPIRNIPYVRHFLRWIEEREHRLAKFIYDVFDCLAYISSILYRTSVTMWEFLWQAVCLLFDQVFGEDKSRRLKSVWALAGLTRTPYMSARARLQKEMAFSEFTDRGDFWSDYESYVKDLQKSGREVGINDIDIHSIGQGMRRRVGWGKPMMTKKEAEYLGFGPGDYYTDPRFQERVDSYIEKGVPQGADAVYLGEDNIDMIRQSIDRYTPMYDPCSADDRNLADSIANALVNEFPEAFLNAEISSPRQVLAYIKQKYAPGSAFIGHYKTREAAFAAGWDEGIMRRAEDNLLSGKYPVMFHHAFVKAQVVDIAKVVEGGKNLRTVVAEDLVTYWMNMICELERNKRFIPRSGGGMGMVLNQNMEKIYKKLIAVKQRGGSYFIADAHEYDSRTKPFIYQGLAALAKAGMTPEAASVMEAKYKSLQKSFCFGITEPLNRNALSVIVEDKALRVKMAREHPHDFIELDDLRHQFPDYKWEEDKKGQKEHKIHRVYQNKVVLAPSFRDLYSADIIPNRDTCRIYAPVYCRLRRGSSDTSLVPDDDYLGPTEQRRAPVEFLQQLSKNKEVVVNVHFKNRGGGTGENATSWDGLWGFRIALIAGWLRYFDFEKKPEDFFKENFLANTTDDSAWASLIKKKDVNIEKMKQAFSYYGIDLDLEPVDRIEAVEYLSKGVRKPTEEDRNALDAWRVAIFEQMKSSGKAIPKRKPNPDYIVYQHTEQILMRRSAFRYFHGSVEGRKYLHSSIQRSVGHAMVTAFAPQLYSIFRREYIEDVRTLARYYGFKTKQEFEVEFSTCKFGLPQVQLRYQPQRPGSRKAAFIDFLRANRFPAYIKVLKTHMKPEEHDPQEHDKFMRALTRKKPQIDEIARVSLDVFREWIGEIPREIYKMTPNLLSLYPDATFYTENCYVEKFIWKAHLEKTGKEIDSAASFQSLCQQSPYGAVTDAGAFYQNMQDPLCPMRQEIDETPAEVYANMNVLITLLYTSLYILERRIVMLLIIGAIYRFIMAMLIDLPKLYSVLNLIYWHVEAESSPTISALMPRDAYIPSKRFSAFIIDMIPFQVGYLLPFYRITKWLIGGVVQTSRFFTWNQTLKHTRNDTPFKNPWDAVVANQTPFETHWLQDITTGEGPKPIVISAGTGTGKSSLFPFSLLQKSAVGSKIWHSKRIWIAFPRRVLRDQWKSPLAEHYPLYAVQRLKQGVPLEPNVSGQILLGTYGHLFNRIKAGQVDKDDVFLCDEFHESSGEMISVVEALYGFCHMIFLSATPTALPGIETSYLEPDIPQRFSKTVHLRDDSPVNNFFWANDHYPEQAKQAIIRVVTYREVNEVRDALHYRNIKTHELSARTSDQDIPEDAVIVATSVIDAGISIPGRRLLISSGQMLSNFEGSLRKVSTDAITEKQIEGRVGRYQDGDVVVRPSPAGTGPTPKPYSAPGYFQSKLYSEYTNVMRLVLSAKDGYTTYPEMIGIAIKSSKEPRLDNALGLAIYLTYLGVPMDKLKEFYNKALQRRLPEEYENATSFMVRYSIDHVHIDIIMAEMTSRGIVYTFEKTGKGQLPPLAERIEWPHTSSDPNHMNTGEQLAVLSRRPLYPLTGRWQSRSNTRDRQEVTPTLNAPGQAISKAYQDMLQGYEDEKLRLLDRVKEFYKIEEISSLKKAFRKFLKEEELASKKSDHRVRSIEEYDEKETTFTIGKNSEIYARQVQGECRVCAKVGEYHVHLEEDLLETPYIPHLTKEWVYLASAPPVETNPADKEHPDRHIRALDSMLCKGDKLILRPPFRFNSVDPLDYPPGACAITAMPDYGPDLSIEDWILFFGDRFRDGWFTSFEIADFLSHHNINFIAQVPEQGLVPQGVFAPNRPSVIYKFVGDIQAGHWYDGWWAGVGDISL